MDDLLARARGRLLGQFSPVDVGRADAACEVFEATAWRTSIIEGLQSWS